MKTEINNALGLTHSKAEQAVLGAMLIDVRALNIALKMLFEQDFDTKQHQWLFKNLGTIYQEVGTIDEIIVSERLCKLTDSDSKKIAIKNYLAECWAACPTASNIESYCIIVKEHSLRRQFREQTLLLQKGEREGHDIRTLGYQFSEWMASIESELDNKDSTRELDEQYADEISGKRVNIPFPSFPCTTAVHCLVPGTITLFLGRPKSGKSTLIRQWLYQWYESGISVSTMMLESGAVEHLRCTEAQMAQCPDLLKPLHSRLQPELTMQLHDEFRPRIERLQRDGIVQEPSVKSPDVSYILRWMDEQGRAGRRIVIIDPISAMIKSKNGWMDDARLMNEGRQIVRRHKLSAIFVMHPAVIDGKEPLKPTSTAIPGAKAYQNLIDAALWWKSHPRCSDEFKPIDEYGRELTDQLSINREHSGSIHVVLARRPGFQSEQIACCFDPRTLQCVEAGWL